MLTKADGEPKNRNTVVALGGHNKATHCRSTNREGTCKKISLSYFNMGNTIPACARGQLLLWGSSPDHLHSPACFLNKGHTASSTEQVGLCRHASDTVRVRLQTTAIQPVSQIFWFPSRLQSKCAVPSYLKTVHNLI